MDARHGSVEYLFLDVRIELIPVVKATISIPRKSVARGEKCDLAYIAFRTVFGITTSHVKVGTTKQ